MVLVKTVSTILEVNQMEKIAVLMNVIRGKDYKWMELVSIVNHISNHLLIKSVVSNQHVIYAKD